MLFRTFLLISAAMLPLPVAAQPAASGSGEEKDPAILSQPDPAATRTGTLWGTTIRKDQFKPLTGKQRWDLYLRRTYWSPGAYVRAAGIAALDQSGNEPAEWGQGAEAYMKRVGDKLARRAIKESLEAAGAAALQQDVRYIKCPCTGVWKRSAFAIASNFVTLNRNGRWVPAYARFGAAAGAEYIGNSWMPPGYRNWSTSLRDAGLQLSFTSAFNLVREFFPQKRPKP